MPKNRPCVCVGGKLLQEPIQHFPEAAAAAAQDTEGRAYPFSVAGEEGAAYLGHLWDWEAHQQGAQLSQPLGNGFCPSPMQFEQDTPKN